MLTKSIKKSKTPEVEADFEFSDTKAMTCLLCSRQFKTIDQLKRHNKESDLHKVRERERAESIKYRL